MRKLSIDSDGGVAIGNARQKLDAAGNSLRIEKRGRPKKKAVDSPTYYEDSRSVVGFEKTLK